MTRTDVPTRTKPRFGKGDRVASTMNGSTGVVFTRGSRPGIGGTVRRYYVRWDATGFASWVDEDSLDPAPDPESEANS